MFWVNEANSTVDESLQTRQDGWFQIKWRIYSVIRKPRREMSISTNGIVNNCVLISVATVLKHIFSVPKLLHPCVQVIDVKFCTCFLYFSSLYLKSGSGLGFMQTSKVLPQWLNVSFLIEPYLISETYWNKKSPAQTIAMRSTQFSPISLYEDL